MKDLKNSFHSNTDISPTDKLDKKSSPCTQTTVNMTNEVPLLSNELGSPVPKNYIEDDDDIENEDFFKEKLEIRRWFILIVFVLLSGLNGAGWGTYSAIVDESKEYYNVGSQQVLWFTWEFYFTYVVFSFMGSKLLDKSFAISMIAGGALNVIGVWIRYFAFKTYILALLGQILISVSSCVMLAAPNTLANLWYHCKERFFVVSVAVFANSLGTGIGFLFSPIIAEKQPERINDVLFYIAIATTIPFILCLLIIKKGPKYSPNISVAIKKESFYQSIILLLKNKKFMMASLSFGINYSNCWNVLGVIGVFLSDDNVSPIVVGYIGLAFILAGMLGSFAGTFFLKYMPNSRRYFDPIVKFLMTLSTLSFVVASIIVPIGGHLEILIPALMFLGLGSLGLSPFECVALEEFAFPVPESVSVNSLFFLASLFGYPISILSTLEVFGQYGLWVFTISGIPFSIYALFFYKTEFKKSDKEGHFSSFNENKLITYDEHDPLEQNQNESVLSSQY